METNARQKIIESMGASTVLSKRILDTMEQLGEYAVPGLVDVMQDWELMNEDSKGEGFIPILAAKILAERKETSAIDPMLDLLMELDPLTETYEEIEGSAGKLLSGDISKAIARFYAAKEREDKIRIENILQHCRSKDSRVFDIYVDNLRSGYELSASHLVDFGDPRAIPIISEALDNFVLSDSAFENHAVFELQHALEELGAKLTPKQKFKIKSAHLIADKTFAPLRNNLGFPIERDRVKTGRNDPCPCNSGKKYKKCCLMN